MLKWFIVLFLITSPVLAEEKEVKRNELGFSFHYALTSDYADELEPRVYQHALGGEVSLSKVTRFNLNFSAGLGLYYKSLGSSIWSDERNGYYGVEFSSFDLGASKRFKFKYFDIGTMISHSFFMSDEDRLEGYHGVSTAGGSISKSFWKGRYTLSNSVSASYMFNEYSESPGTGASNVKYFFNYTFNNIVSICPYLSIAAGFGFKRTYQHNDFVNNSFMSFAAVNGRYKGFSLSLKYSNGDFLHRDNVRLWYVDEYRKVVTLMLGFSF